MNADPASGAFLASFLFFLLTVASVAIFLMTAAIRRLRRERDELIHQEEVIFGFIHDVGDVFVHSEDVDIERMLDRVLFYAERTTRASAGAVYLYERAENAFKARALSGIFPPLESAIEEELTQAVSKSLFVEQQVRSQLIPRGKGLVGEVADFGSAILIEHADRDARVPRHVPDFLRIESILLVPMRFLRKVLGVVVVVNPIDGRPFNQADLSLLQALADQASVSIHYAGLRDSLNEKQRLDHDLAIARQIQTALLPHAIPELPGIELAAFTHPAQEIGGDYYDFIRIDDDHIGMAVADVSGKGVVGAMMMAISRSALRTQAAQSLSPAAVLREVNRIMFEDIAEDMFVSMLYMIFTRSTRELVVARAGHERPAIIGGGDQLFQIIDAPGLALGMADNETFDAALREERVQLAPGDLLVAYTDGITEAQNESGDEWGVEKFLEAVSAAAPSGTQAVLQSVQQGVLRFAGAMPQYDDMTLLTLRIQP
jgi:sigma-B regulation protein RsbU (phosphoserine phosphatase)